MSSEKTELFLGLDNTFLPNMLKTAIPVVIHLGYQYFFAILDILIISKMGERSVAAIGIGAEFYYLLILILTGISTGTCIFTAQYWGSKDIAKIKRVMGFAILLGSISTLFMICIMQYFAPAFLRFYTNDEQVIQMGVTYIRFVSFGYVFVILEWIGAPILRTFGESRVQLYNAIVAIGVNTSLNYCLTTGSFGFPNMGVLGVAVAFVISKVCDFVGIAYFLFTFKGLRGVENREYFNFFDLSFVSKLLKTITPAFFNSILYGLGIMTFSFTFAHISVYAVASYQSYRPFLDFSSITLNAIATASMVMVGNKIGEGNSHTGYRYAKRFIFISLGFSFLISIILLIFSNRISYIFGYTEQSRLYFKEFLWVISIGLPIRAVNIAYTVGSLRPGGDTMFVMATEISSIWLFGAGLSMLAGFYFHLPPFFVLLLTLTDEIFKLVVLTSRFVSKRWIRNLTHV